jgi:hypothetical protein
MSPGVHGAHVEYKVGGETNWDIIFATFSSVFTIGSIIMGCLYPTYALGFFVLAIISLSVTIASLSHLIFRIKVK